MGRVLQDVLLLSFMYMLTTAQTGCRNGDVRLRGKHSNSTAISAGLDVCVDGRWRTVCRNNAWNSNTVRNENPRVACRQLGYREEGATNQAINESIINRQSPTAVGLRQSSCNGTEERLIDCPQSSGTARCSIRALLTCRREPCDANIRLRDGRTATEGRVEVCRDGEWGTVCDESWDRNDASVTCRQLGFFNFNAVPVPSTAFGLGSGKIHLSNLQCTGSEATLTDCTFSTQHTCSHNEDASVICQQNEPQCFAGEIRIAYNSEVTSMEVCTNQLWRMCTDSLPCFETTAGTQHGTYICGNEIQHFFLADDQWYKCPISEASDLLLCTPMHDESVTVVINSCQKVLQDIELQASSSSLTVTWENENFMTTTAQQEVTCSPDNSVIMYSIVVDAATSEVTVENLPHSTTYECCVTLHIGRYSTRACGSTATLADVHTTELPQETATTQPIIQNSQLETDAIQGAGLWVIIALGVLVAVLVLLLALVAGACLCLLVSKKNKHQETPTSTNGNTCSTSEERYFENPSYTNYEIPKITAKPSTTLPPAPPHTLTPPFPTEEVEVVFSNSQYSVVQPVEGEGSYSNVDKNGRRTSEEDYSTFQMPTYEVPIISMESLPTQERPPQEYSRLQH